jgi:hypothetical protein
MTDMTTPTGTWTVIISTPIGKQHVTLRISEQGGGLAGTATQGAETVPFIDTTWDGDRLRWSQDVTKPMRLHIKFDVNVSGDEMTGTAKAGVFPASKLEGKRAPVSRP